MEWNRTKDWGRLPAQGFREDEWAGTSRREEGWEEAGGTEGAGVGPGLSPLVEVGGRRREGRELGTGYRELRVATLGLPRPGRSSGGVGRRSRVASDPVTEEAPTVAGLSPGPPGPRSGDLRVTLEQSEAQRTPIPEV